MMSLAIIIIYMYSYFDGYKHCWTNQLSQSSMEVLPKFKKLHYTVDYGKKINVLVLAVVKRS